ncbi:MAG: DUF1501 domain-containing protein [Planctomycetota bacterium]
MLNRRTFLGKSSLLSLAPIAPAFLSRTAFASKAGKDNRILVVIELEGGNDGLNTVIPFSDDHYAEYRKSLRIETKDVLKLSDSMGLHPAMKEAAELFDSGRLAVIPGVGYPNPSRSHFRSQAIWHSARMNTVDHNGHGWLGRTCDEARDPGSSRPDAVFVGDGAIPAAIIGRRTNSIALNNENELELASSLELPEDRIKGDDLSAFVRHTVTSSYDAAKRFSESNHVNSSNGDGPYPNDGFARKLRLLSRIIRIGGGTRVFYVSLRGFDTHSAQAFSHERLLRQYSRALKAFLDDMRSHKLSDQITVLTFSEFGRQLRENASAGTDHGTCGPVFIAGDAIKPGILSAYPSLTDLENDEMKSTVDFRTIYASLLEDWLGTESMGPLGGSFKPLPVVV